MLLAIGAPIRNCVGSCRPNSHCSSSDTVPAIVAPCDNTTLIPKGRHSRPSRAARRTAAPPSRHRAPAECSAPGGTFASLKAPSHRMRPPNPVPDPGRPLWPSGTHADVAGGDIVPSALVTRPEIRRGPDQQQSEIDIERLGAERKVALDVCFGQRFDTGIVGWRVGRLFWRAAWIERRAAAADVGRSFSDARRCESSGSGSLEAAAASPARRSRGPPPGVVKLRATAVM